jgi:predicted AAA+ superfamily ATPase
MAITNVQTNILFSMQQIAVRQLELQNLMSAAVAMYAAEGLNALVDADIQAVPAFAHISAQDLQGAKNAMDTINTAIGGYVAGTPATKLLRVVDKVPA